MQISMERSVRLRNKTSNNLRMKASSLYFLNDISNIDSIDNSSPSSNWRDGYTFNPIIIGRGHFSKVYKVKCCSTGNTVAIKVIRRKRLGTDKIDDIMQEIEIMQITNKSCNPGFIQLLKVHTSPSEVGIVMEFASGGSLYHVTQDSLVGLPEVYVRIVLTKILSALSVMHHQDIVHLDIKADNILLRYPYPSTDIALTDFGLARKLIKSKVLKEMVGTPDYIAPEVANYERISLSSDMWSVGVLTYVLLTNVSPFTGDSKDDTLRRVTKAEFEFVGKLNDESMSTGRTFINSLIIRTPENRLSADECLSHNFLSNVPIVECLPDKSCFSEAPIINLGYQVQVRQNCSYNTRGLVMSQYEIDSSYLNDDMLRSEDDALRTECLDVSTKSIDCIPSNLGTSFHSIDKVNEDSAVQEDIPECFDKGAEKVEEVTGIKKRDEEFSQFIMDYSPICPEEIISEALMDESSQDAFDIEEEEKKCNIFRTEIYDSRRRLKSKKKTKDVINNEAEADDKPKIEIEVNPIKESEELNTIKESEELDTMPIVDNEIDMLKSVVKRRSLSRSIKRNCDKPNTRLMCRSADFSHINVLTVSNSRLGSFKGEIKRQHSKRQQSRVKRCSIS